MSELPSGRALSRELKGSTATRHSGGILKLDTDFKRSTVQMLPDGLFNRFTCDNCGVAILWHSLNHGEASERLQ